MIIHKNSVLVLLWFICTFSFAQDSIPQYEIDKKIIGEYHPFKKTFKSETRTPHKTEDSYLTYSCDKFINGLGIAEKKHFYYTKSFSRTENREIEESHLVNTFGVIDTAGNIVLPFQRKGLAGIVDEVGYRYFFYWLVSDTTVIIDLSNNELARIPSESNGYRIEILPLVLKYQSSDHLRLNVGDKDFIYDLENKKLVLPSFPDGDFSNIKDETYHPLNYAGSGDSKFIVYCNAPRSFDRYQSILVDIEAWEKARHKINRIVYDVPNRIWSEKYKVAEIYHDSLIYLSNPDDSRLITNINHSENILDYEKIEVFTDVPFNRSFNETRLVKQQLGAIFLLVKSEGKFGIVQLNDSVLIPIIYDDIYRIDQNHFWVKKDDYWAISTLNHSLLTEFEFTDIDKMNAVNFENYMWYNVMKDSQIGVEPRSGSSSNFNRGRLTGMYEQYAHTHNYFSVFNWEVYADRRMFAKKNEGYHWLEPDSTGFFVSREAFDNIFISPSYQIGFEKNGKYGFNAGNIEFDRILIWDTYPHYWNLSRKRRVYTAPHMFVRGKFLYGFDGYQPVRIRRTKEFDFSANWKSSKGK